MFKTNKKDFWAWYQDKNPHNLKQDINPPVSRWIWVQAHLTRRDVIGRRDLPAWAKFKQERLFIAINLNISINVNRFLFDIILNTIQLWYYYLLSSSILKWLNGYWIRMEQGPNAHAVPAIQRMSPRVWKLLLGVSSCSSFDWTSPTPFNELSSQETSLISLKFKQLGCDLLSKIKIKKTFLLTMSTSSDVQSPPGFPGWWIWL